MLTAHRRSVARERNASTVPLVATWAPRSHTAQSSVLERASDWASHAAGSHLRMAAGGSGGRAECPRRPPAPPPRVLCRWRCDAVLTRVSSRRSVKHLAHHMIAHRSSAIRDEYRCCLFRLPRPLRRLTVSEVSIWGAGGRERFAGLAALCLFY